MATAKGGGMGVVRLDSVGRVHGDDEVAITHGDLAWVVVPF